MRNRTVRRGTLAVGNSVTPIKSATPPALRADPSRTATIRRRMEAEAAARCRRLKVAITDWWLNVGANVVNSFCPTGKGGGIDPTCSPGGGRKKPGKQLVRLPQTMEEAVALASAARDNIVGMDGECAVDGDCITASERMVRLHPDMEIWRGIYEGGGEHKIVKAGKFFIDITADQFPGGNEINVFTEDDLLRGTHGAGPYQYGGFVKSRAITDDGYGGATGILEDLKEYAGTEGMIGNSGQADVVVETIAALDAAARAQLLNVPWWLPYLRAAYGKGALRSYDSTVVRSDDPTGARRRAERRGFLASLSLVGNAAQPRHSIRDVAGRFMSERMRAASARIEQDIKGATAATAQQITRALLDGLDKGWKPESIARAIAKTVDDVTLKRARLIAKTEVVRAAADGQLDAMEAMGVEEVGALVEWRTQANSKTGPCKQCLPLKGVVFKIREARGMIPRHPGCLCAWVDARSGSARQQKRTRRAAQRAVAQSQREAGPRDDWEPAIEIETRNAMRRLDGSNCGTGAGGFKAGNTCATGGTAKLTPAHTLVESSEGHFSRTAKIKDGTAELRTTFHPDDLDRFVMSAHVDGVEAATFRLQFLRSGAEHKYDVWVHSSTDVKFQGRGIATEAYKMAADIAALYDGVVVPAGDSNTLDAQRLWSSMERTRVSKDKRIDHRDKKVKIKKPPRTHNAYDDALDAFDAALTNMAPNQPRDWRGRWVAEGSAAGMVKAIYADVRADHSGMIPYTDLLAGLDAALGDRSNAELHEAARELSISKPERWTGTKTAEAIKLRVLDMRSSASRQRMTETDPKQGQQAHDDWLRNANLSDKSNCGTGAGGFKPRNTCATGKTRTSLIAEADQAEEELPAPTAGHVRLFRATDEGGNLGKGSHWAEGYSTAKVYTKNPGFGGDTLHYADVKSEYVLDLRGTRRFRDVGEAVADDIIRSDFDDLPKGLQHRLREVMDIAEVARHTKLRRKDIVDAFDFWAGDEGHDHQYKLWEGSPWLKKILADNFDYIRHDSEDFPPGSTTWVKLTDIPISVKVLAYVGYEDPLRLTD